MDIPLPIKIAMRHHVAVSRIKKMRFDNLPKAEREPHYVRLLVTMSLPGKDPYLQKIQSAAAKATKSIPFIRRTTPVQVTLDLPIALEQRKDALKAIRSLPFVEAVTVGSGPRIR